MTTIISTPLAYTLQNGQNADASQVMADLNQIVTNVNSNAAANGINSDITALSGLVTPITPTQGGTYIYKGGTTGGSANVQTIAATTPSTFSLTSGNIVTFIAGFSNSSGVTLNVNGSGALAIMKLSSSGLTGLTTGDIILGQAYEVMYDGTEYQLLGSSAAASNYNYQLFTGSGTFTAPANTTSLTRFKFTLSGSGGGGAFDAGPATAGGGGGAGETVVYIVTGLTAAQTCAIVIGSLGTGGTNAARPGVDGGNSSLTVGATTITAIGGKGGADAASNSDLGGLGGTGGVNATFNMAGEAGGAGLVFGSPALSGRGGSSYWGAGGREKYGTNTGISGNAGIAYASGGAGVGAAAPGVGGNGVAGACLVEYWVA